jgi:hypothetical protein
MAFDLSAITWPLTFIIVSLILNRKPKSVIAQLDLDNLWQAMANMDKRVAEARAAIGGLDALENDMRNLVKQAVRFESKQHHLEASLAQTTKAANLAAIATGFNPEKL